MDSEHSPGRPPMEPVPAAPAPAPSARPTLDELSEASFPASDPPPAWTWETERRPDKA